MLLGQLLKSVNKNHQKIDVQGISFDSRKIKKNYIFLPLKEAKHLEQNLFIKQS